MQEERAEIQLLCQKIKEQKLVVVVEGKKDKAALIKLGIGTNQIKVLDKPLFAVVEDIVEHIHREALPKKVVLLTDLDPTGKKLYAQLRKDFNKHGIIIDDILRTYLWENTKLRQIEGLVNYLRMS